MNPPAPFALVTREALRRCTALGLSELATYVALSSFADRDGRSARPSQATLAEVTGLSRRSIRRALAGLLAEGLVEAVGKASRGVVEYAVHRLEGEAGAATQAAPVLPRRPREAYQGRPRESYNQTLLPDQKPYTPAGTPARVTAPVAAVAGEGAGRSLGDEVEELLGEGVGRHLAPPQRRAALEALVVAYRRRWPESWPTDWRFASEHADLSGPIKDRGGWIWAHVAGYAGGGWKPESKDGSPRKWHAALLGGRLEEALSAKKREASYRGANRLRLEREQGEEATRRLGELVRDDEALAAAVGEAIRHVGTVSKS